MRRLVAAVVLGLAAVAGWGQAPSGSDPLAVGKKAMDRGDYAAAHAFFAGYVTENPGSMEAVFYLGGSDLGLKDYDAAVKEFQRVVEKMPNAWSAHSNLALAYAQKGDWAGFDKERAAIKAARDAKTARVDKDEYDVVDRFEVDGDEYEVRYFYTLHGHYNVRYVFLHFAKDGKVDHWLQLESDDADQSFFQQEHPKEAKAGDRRYSLDTYTQSEKGQTQGLIRFYDGEPQYEALRKDVMGVLAKKTRPSATSTFPDKKK